MVLAFVVHEEASDISGIEEIAHRAEGKHNHAVVVVIAALDFSLIDTDHFKTQAINGVFLCELGLAGERPAPGFVAYHRYAGALKLIFFAEAAAGRNSKTTDAFV